jgi:very-short-patch-repair endonuclease
VDAAGSTTPHIAVASTASRVNQDDVTVHWARGPVPVISRSSEEPLINTLFDVTRCAEPMLALAVWESALRKQLITASELARVKWRSTAAQRFSAVAGHLSDSGLETLFMWIMRQIGVEVQQQVWLDRHPVDGLIGERLVTQIDGFAHHREAADRRRDIRADARLVLRGYTVLRFDYYQVLFDPAFVQNTVLTAIAQGLHRAR